MTPLLTALAIFFGAILLAALYVRFRPIVIMKSGPHSTVHPLHIELGRDAPYPAARLAQEISDQRAFLSTEWLWNKKEVELRGHAIECAAVEILYGADPIAYAQEEAGRMDDYSVLSGMNQAERVAALVSRLPKARGWVVTNRKFLEAYR